MSMSQLTRGLRTVRPVASPSCVVASGSSARTMSQRSRGQCVARAAATPVVPDEEDVNFEELSEIIKLVNSTDIVEMEWKGKKFNLSVRKREALKAAEPVYQVVPQAPVQYAPAPAPAAAPAPAPAPAPAAAPAAPKPAAPPAATGGIEIQSPMSGTFYACAAPGEAAFVKVGDRVKKGQTVGIIEAMKLMNEIEAEVSGEVIRVMVENGKPINAGQPLMVIRP